MYVIIAGGGLLGGSLAKKLSEGHHDVVVIEREQAVCEQIAARVGALVIHGTATEIDTLDEAGMDKADVAVGALPFDGENLAFTILARNFEVPRIMARMRNPRYETAYKIAGVSKCINVSEFFVNQLVLEIEEPQLRQVASFGSGQAAIVVATIPEGARASGKTVKDIAQDEQFPRECIIAGIFRKQSEEFIFPRGGIEVLAGDQVFLAADTANIRKAAQFLQRTK